MKIWLKLLLLFIVFSLTILLPCVDQKLENLQKTDHSSCNCFAVVVLSHGSDDNILTTDGEQIEVKTISGMFLPENCISLLGKPKIFIYQVNHFLSGCFQKEKKI